MFSPRARRFWPQHPLRQPDRTHKVLQMTAGGAEELSSVLGGSSAFTLLVALAAVLLVLGASWEIIYTDPQL